MCRRVLDIAGSPSPLTPAMTARTGLTHANQLPALTAEDRERLRAIRSSQNSSAKSEDIYEAERERIAAAKAAAVQQGKI